jgi:hypothetical protein
MAMLLVVAATEATDPTRESGPFPSAANASEFSRMRIRGETDGVAEEVRAGANPAHVTPPHETHQTNGTCRVHIFGRRRYRLMAAKKKAAKKPAKKAAKKSSKKK